MVCAASFAISFWALPALAQPAADVGTAVTLARDAKERYDAGDWQGALVLFEAAEKKAHSPVLGLYIARCQRQAGRWLLAREVYSRVAAEELAPNAPEPFVNARSDARRELEVLEGRIPRVTLELVGIPAEATVQLDGAVVARGDLTTPMRLDPGSHVAVATSRGGELARIQFVADEGRTSKVRLEVRAAPKASPPRATPPRKTSGSYVPGAVLLGAGVAGLAAGTVTRVVAFQKVSDVEGRCDVNNRCLAGDESSIDTAETLQTVSTVCLVVGGAAAAAGVVLLIVRPGGTDAPSAALRLSPGWSGVAGAF
jgi:hypothetical protein